MKRLAFALSRHTAALAVVALLVPLGSPAPARAQGGAGSDLTVAILAAPDPVEPGHQLTYRIGLRNRGPRPASNVSLATSVPAGTGFVSVAAPAGWVASAPEPEASGAVTFTHPTVPAGPSLVFLVTVRVAPGAASGTTIANTAMATSGTAEQNPDDNAAAVETRVDERTPLRADLRLDLDPFPTPAPAGGRLVAMLILTNLGPEAATGVTVRAPVPAGTVLVHASASHGDVSAPAAGGTGDVVCTLPLVPVRRPLVITVVLGVTAAAGSALQLRALADSRSTDPSPANNAALLLVPVAEPGPAADLSIALEDAPDPVETGSVVTYTATATNAGPAPARDVNAVVEIPRGARFDAAATDHGFVRTPPRGTTGAVGWRIGLLAPGASATLVVRLRVVANGGPPLETSAIVAGGSADPSLANNAASARTRVRSIGEVLVQWDPPDLRSGAMAPPRNLVAIPSRGGLAKAAPGASEAAVARDDEATVVGYNVYSSSDPDPEPTDENYFATVPPNQTVVTVPVAPGGSFFTVTADYAEGESATSNSGESGTTAGATLTKVKMTSKITATGSGFTGTVEVLLDGIPFAGAAKVKKGQTKVVQKGSLAIGQTIEEYTATGGDFLIIFRNDDGTATVYAYEP